ncbi:uncharacterized protein [Lolium perenne]|uniref:uncharacterized protein n=1 Tax=Lolium perenne TaxID=4522 RepID=UPI0021F65496|nr:ethylene-responsive transcription factor 1-like [Lolium perenne]
MPPRRRPASGYHGIQARSSGRFDAEIRSGDERIRLGTYDTAHEAARAYDAVAWRLGRSRRSMNFHDVYTREQAEMLVPPPPVITQEQQRRQRKLEQCLLIAERDEAMRLEWARRFPEDVTATEAFYTQKEEEKAAEKAKKKASHCENEVEATDVAPEGDYELVYEEPDLSGGVEGVDYGIVYGPDNNEAEE